MTRTVLRAIAIAIAVAGAIDPAIPSVRRVKPEIGLVAADRLPEPGLVDRVAQSLASRFTVVRGPSLGAAAIVSIGYQLPPTAALNSPVAFAVAPEPRRPFAAITSVAVPARAQLHAHVPIAVRVQAMAARGRTLTVTLDHSGVVVDRVTRAIASDDAVETIELGLVPTVVGDMNAVVRVTVSDNDTSARADVSLQVADNRWPVLFFDRRPSWMSTFVRRAAESDPRFVVTSRVATSRGAATSAGRPPAALTSLPALELFYTVIAGAPEELSDADVSGLDAFMRERGGTVILLMDVVSERRPFDRLTGVTRWNHVNRAEPAGSPLASELWWPATMPAWAEPLGPGDFPAPDSTPPAIWTTAVGRGRLVVSGALDAWRYRDRDSDGFDRFWRGAIAAAAAATPPMDAAQSPQAPHAELHAATPDQRDLLRAWTSSRRGELIAEARLETLGPALDQQLDPPSERRTLYPMRSGWWILAFAVALGGEWWARRRSGRR